MSASITLYCDREWQYGGCTSQLITDAATINEARQAASGRGWRSHPDGNDYCPTCSGSSSPRRTNVVHLHQGDDPA
jgi:hypothetical protein